MNLFDNALKPWFEFPVISKLLSTLPNGQLPTERELEIVEEARAIALAGNPRRGLRRLLDFPSRRRSSFLFLFAQSEIALVGEDFKLAAAAAEQMLSNGFDFVPAHIALAGAKHRLGDTEGAIKVCARCAELHPKNPLPFVTLASVAASEGNAESSFDLYRVAMEMFLDSENTSFQQRSEAARCITGWVLEDSAFAPIKSRVVALMES